MTRTRARRTIISIAGGLVAFAIVVASAASLGGITSTNLGADDSVVASCDTNGVNSSYTTEYASGLPGFRVDQVTVSNLNDACDGDSMTVTLTGSGNTSLGQQTVTIPTDAATTAVADFSTDNALAEGVTGIHIVVTG